MGLFDIKLKGDLTWPLYSRSFRWLYCCACKVTLVITDTLIVILTYLLTYAHRHQITLLNVSLNNLSESSKLVEKPGTKLHDFSDTDPTFLVFLPMMPAWKLGRQRHVIEMSTGAVQKPFRDWKPLQLLSCMHFTFLTRLVLSRQFPVLLPHCMECRRGLAIRILSVCLSHVWIVTKR